MSEQILSKVRNLLALSKNDNVHESSAAYKAAQKLLTKNRLTMADVYASAEKSREPIITSNEPLYAGIRAINWKGSLAAGITKANCCSCYWHSVWVDGRWNKQLLVVGRQSDIDVVRYLFSAVVAQIEAYCAAAMLRNRGGGKTFANNFKYGATNTVVERLAEAQQEVEEEYEGTTALVLVNKDKAELDVAMKALKLRKRTVKSRYDDRGQEAGKRAGRRVNLSRGALGDSKPKGYIS